MVKRYSKGILTIWLALSLTGCGAKEQAIIDNYGTDTGSVIETSTTGGASSNSVSEGSLSQKLGGTEYDWSASFTATGVSVDLNAHSEIKDTDQLPSYKISAVREEDIDEDTIVKNLLGSDTVKLDRDLDWKTGDSKELVHAAQALYFKYHQDEIKSLSYQEEMDLSKISGWMEEGDYYFHSYEGEYNRIDYQLLIGYDRKENAAHIAFFPKNLGDYFGNQNLDTIES